MYKGNRRIRRQLACYQAHARACLVCAAETGQSPSSLLGNDSGVTRASGGAIAAGLFGLAVDSGRHVFQAGSMMESGGAGLLKSAPEFVDRATPLYIACKAVVTVAASQPRPTGMPAGLSRDGWISPAKPGRCSPAWVPMLAPDGYRQPQCRAAGFGRTGRRRGVGGVPLSSASASSSSLARKLSNASWNGSSIAPARSGSGAAWQTVGMLEAWLAVSTHLGVGLPVAKRRRPTLRPDACCRGLVRTRLRPGCVAGTRRG